MQSISTAVTLRPWLLSIAVVGAGLLMTTQARAQEGYEIGFSSSEAVLASNGDPTVLHLESWDSPLVRIVERNMPFIELTNTSANGAALTEFRMTIGDTLFNFSDAFLGDFAVLGTTTPGVQLTASTEMNGDELVVQFDNGGLAAGDTVRFKVDIDRDDPSSGFLYPDFRTVFFDLANPGSNADNSLTTSSFSTGSSLSLIIGDQSDPGGLGVSSALVNTVRPYSTMENVELFEAIVAGVIPEPSSIGLIALGLVVAANRRRR